MLKVNKSMTSLTTMTPLTMLSYELGSCHLNLV